MAHPSTKRPIRDFVIPVCNLKLNRAGQAISADSNLAGTSFLIGSRGFALTAAHVIDQTSDQTRFGLVAVDEGKGSTFHAVKIVASEQHPTEDVGILQFYPFPDGARISFFAVSGRKEYQSLDYHMWSYPAAVAEEIKLHGLPEDHLQFRPDITFFKGYVRRRMPFSPNPTFSAYKGSLFFEVSEIGGSCSSGSPLVSVRGSPTWDVFALYVGEETTNRKCGYSVSMELIADWVPKILGVTVRDEASSSASLG